MFIKKIFNILPVLAGLLLFVSVSAEPIGNELYNVLYQRRDSLRNALTKDSVFVRRDTLAKRQDSLSLQDSLRSLTDSSYRDSLKMHSDSLRHRDSLKNKGSLDFPVFSTARDSIIEDFSGGKKMIYYYGDVKVTYDNMEITADYMAYDMDAKTVFAKGLPDTTGKVTGKPVMKQGEGTYEMESVYYNFGSQKAKIKNMITQEQDGYLHGKFIKKMPDNSINIAKGKYTTCDCEHPHFYLHMTNAKVINEPGGGQKTVFGPSYVVLEDVPTPFALPFGFVPKFGSRSSGILIPSYGEENARGFFLRGLGYYFVFGDHFDLAATADIYTMGSWGVQLNSRYNKRYKYNGNFAMTYSNDQTGEKNSPDFFQTKNFSLQWSHSQDGKARPGTTFRASVNFSSPSNNRYNSTDLNNALQNQISSSISYGKTWAGTPFSFSVNALHSQSSRDSSYSITFPNLTFTVNRIFPFKRKERVGKEKFYETFAFNYNTTLENRISFKAKEVNEPDFLKKMKNGMKHNFSISLPSFSLAKYIQASPSISYGMNWYFTDATKTFNEETQKVETIYSDPFSTFGITQTVSGGISFSTRLYGLFNFGKKRRIEAIRHMVTPTVSFSAQPEMGTTANGFSTLNYVDANGKQNTLVYNKYDGQIYTPPSRGKSASMSFSINNNIEAKIRDQKDTTGKGTKKIKLIDQLSIGGSYNFLADSMNLSNISLSLSTTVFGKMGLNAGATLDPYAVNKYGTRINRFNVVQEGGFKLFRLVGANASVSYTFSGEGKSRLGSNYKPDGKNIAPPDSKNTGHGNEKPQQSQATFYQRMYYHPVTGEFIPGGWVYYMDPNVPWSLSLSYSYNYNRSYQYANEQLKVKHNHLQTLGISGQLKLSDKLNFNITTGVDLMKMKLTSTQLSATYDLHCFAISISWIPQGQWESWSFRINAKASALADLLQFKKNASYWDR